MEIEAVLTADELTVVGRLVPRRPDEPPVEVRRTLAGPSAAQDTTGMATAARTAFEKLGDTRLELASFAWRNAENRFVPVSRLNQLRRDLAAALEEALQAASAERVDRALADVCPPTPSPNAGGRRSVGRSRWTASASWTPSSRRTGPASRS